MKKILLIEDNKDMRENTAEILELANYKVITAKNGKEGVEAAIKEIPDLIICDIMMPVLDGYGVLHALSRSHDTAGIPFIFLTAKAERSEVRKGMEMGADDYLTKPFDDIELLNAVEMRMKKIEALKKEFTHDLDGLNDFIRSAHSIDDLKKLAEEQEVIVYKKKGIIYQLGGYPRGAYFLSKGKVKAYKPHETGKDYIIARYKEGDFFGYTALLEESKYTHSAEALEDCEIMFIPKNNFTSLIFKNALVSRKFIKMLSNNIAEQEEQLMNLAYSSVRKRVASALVTLWDEAGPNKVNNGVINVLREDLASMVGTAKETLIRTLGDFKESGFIEIQERSIKVKNYDKLAHMNS